MTPRSSLLPLGLMLALASCRAATSAPPSAASPAVPKPEPRTSSTPEAQPQSTAVAAEASPLTSLPLQTSRDDPSVGACEWSCADLHDCALLAADYTPAAAASIELGCIRACLDTPSPAPTRSSVFGCQRPTELEPDSCNPFLDCVAVAWPDGRSVRPVIEDAPIGDGCTRGCEAFARCYDPSTPADKVTRCGEMCRQALDQRQQEVFGECARQPNCDAVISCVASTPGA